MVDILGCTFVALTYMFLALGEGIVVFQLIPLWFTKNNEYTWAGIFWMIIYNICMILAIISHLKALLGDPGYTPNLQIPDSIPLERLRYCDRCSQWKPERTHHCSTCQRCIQKMDHHCPWINNCVGAKNQKSFVLFLVYVFLVCLLTLIIMSSITYWYFTRSSKRVVSGSLFLFIASVMTSIFALTFMLFTAIMFWEQLWAIIHNQTEVEEMNRRIAPQKPIFENLKNSMGISVIMWWNPFAEPPEPDYMEPLEVQPKTESSTWVYWVGYAVCGCVILAATFIIVKVIWIK